MKLTFIREIIIIGVNFFQLKHFMDKNMIQNTFARWTGFNQNNGREVSLEIRFTTFFILNLKYSPVEFTGRSFYHDFITCYLFKSACASGESIEI
ncbi:hypothetical protein MATR_19920 [Marivirga tractuosa]|uniref:Uncharacterized protein n=1 Tax=Marivirga tractuosa (strain ATCC 23168 / DSM 4126 / NBRC 15989 / NCIMB 1408 / VKM B-1430 / H-43) TaxID=643867 RepID=E4TND2_MARTH|nr:hypothetical protein Ftrac_0382 [Marivirga tractuosa DSM 4126]BDD15167.1 hypothetical protein MATR_19920 [Marivirga tractuosa]